jgi:DNA polymerase/3'-5' exonuclease PolX
MYLFPSLDSVLGRIDLGCNRSDVHVGRTNNSSRQGMKYRRGSQRNMKITTSMLAKASSELLLCSEPSVTQSLKPRSQLSQTCLCGDYRVVRSTVHNIRFLCSTTVRKHFFTEWIPKYGCWAHICSEQKKNNVSLSYLASCFCV